MKLPRTALLLLAAWSCGAGEFRNLGFDQPEIPDFAGVTIPGSSFEGAAEDWVIPGWDVLNGVGHGHTQPFQNGSSLLDHDYVNTRQPASPAKVPVVDSCSLGIWPYSGSRFREVPFVLKQTGDIPADAQSLRFLYPGPGDFKVYVGGAERLVHFTESRPSGDPEIPSLDYFVVDVGLFAGQTAELRFEFFRFGNYPGQDGGPFAGRPDAKFHVLDDLSFSPLPDVPEPATWAPLTAGLAAAFAGSRRR
jgi:hypothetical protein